METKFILMVIDKEKVGYVKDVFGNHFVNNKDIDNKTSKVLLHVTEKEVDEIYTNHPELISVKVKHFSFDGDAIYEFAREIEA